MDWKEFFNIDKRKMSVFFVVMVIVMFLTGYMVLVMIGCSASGGCRYEPSARFLADNFQTFLIIFFPFLPIAGILKPYGAVSLLAIFPLYYYAWSCLLMYLYDKFKNRKLKKKKK